MIVIKNSKLRRFLKIVIPFVMIPLLVAVGAVFADGKRHLLISLGVAVLTLLLFATGFERKAVGSRRMVIAAVFVALCIAGRFIPLFKPVTALTVIAAVYLGGETGFAVGALSALLSNFYFGQGPWTPFQMLAWGAIGLVAGAFASPLKRNRMLLVIYGVASGILYSFIMDMWTVMWYNGSLDKGLYLSAVVAAVPHTVAYAISNVIFLWFLAKPFGDKLERIKIKYGI